jgi:hypothetical protein
VSNAAEVKRAMDAGLCVFGSTIVSSVMQFSSEMLENSSLF